MLEQDILRAAQPQLNDRGEVKASIGSSLFPRTALTGVAQQYACNQRNCPARIFHTLSSLRIVCLHRSMKYAGPETSPPSQTKTTKLHSGEIFWLGPSIRLRLRCAELSSGHDRAQAREDEEQQGDRVDLEREIESCMGEAAEHADPQHRRESARER